MLSNAENVSRWIGREEQIHGFVTPDLVQRFNATLGTSAGAGIGDPAPEMIHLCICQPAIASSGLGEDGHERRGGFLPPVDLPRRMWAGGSVEFHGPIYVGDSVQRRSRIENIMPKQGRTGPLCFVEVIHELFSQGRLAVTEHQSIVYRGEGRRPPLSETVPQGRYSKAVQVDTTLLFRYSALTFNGHRIHYDIDWAREKEGYPGLIVHGPLQATMLVHFATVIRKSPPARFSFKSIGTIFHTDEMELHAEDDGSNLRMWTVAVGGPVAMEATAEW